MAWRELLWVTHLPSGFICGAGKVQRPCVCGCAAHGEPHPLRLIGVHSPVIGVGVHVGEGIIQLERAHCLDVILAASYLGQ